MKILITGGAGFIGSELTEYLINNVKNIKLTLIDNLSQHDKSRIKHLNNKIKFIKSDVKNINSLKIKKFDWIIHTSAIAALPDNQVDHGKSITENIAQCGSIVDFCIKTGTKNILFFSSAAIYENTNTKNLIEDKLNQPKLMYPLSKYLAEKYFRSITESYNLNVVSLRLANIYGRNQDYNRKQPPFLGYLIKNTLLNNKLTLFAKGNYKRDYLFIDDLSKLIIKIIKNKKFARKNKIFEYLNVGSGQRYSVPDFIKLIEKIFNKKVLLTWGKKTDYWKKYDSLYNSKIKFHSSLIEKEVKKKVSLNLKKVHLAYKWKAEYDINHGLIECINHAKKILRL